jgi:hypothetical protein
MAHERSAVDGTAADHMGADGGGGVHDRTPPVITAAPHPLTIALTIARI